MGAAEELFVARGFGATSVEEIATVVRGEQGGVWQLQRPEGPSPGAALGHGSGWP